METYSLCELNKFVKQQLQAAVPDFYWVTGEINELSVNSGHCYMELIEKSLDTGQIVAKARTNIWAYHYRMLRPYFELTTGQELAKGMKVMFKVSVEFHELYGMSLQVTDINPAFTVGDLALQKQAIIKRLTEDGVIDMNKELPFPEIIQRIAVISSESAAGYGDFINQLQRNPYQFTFRHELFQALMQGNGAEKSIIQAFDRIFERENEFDAVILIRGGGSQSDLSCFDSYALASYIAQFPLPVITGIGHERDNSIADMVACRSLKTPTAVAEFIISIATTLHENIEELAVRAIDIVNKYLQEYKDTLRENTQHLQTIMVEYVRGQEKALQSYKYRIERAASEYLTNERFVIKNNNIRFLAVRNVIKENSKKIERLQEKCMLLNPENLLQRGFSITKTNGKTIRNATDLLSGQHIETIFHDGSVESIIQ